MEKRVWHNNKVYEIFSVLYDDGRIMLVQNDETHHFSFGPSSDFGTLYGFGVNQSCLTRDETVSELTRWIEIDRDNKSLTETYRAMLQILLTQ